MQVNGNVKVIGTRLIEAFIIGGVVMYGSVKMNQNNIDTIKDSLSKIETDFSKFKERIEKDFYVPRFQTQSAILNHPALKNDHRP